MPFSQSSQLSAIVGYAERLQPQSVLDVGTGMGQYGFLLRNNLEAEGLFIVEGRSGWQRPRQDWRVRIDGIEGFAGYLTPVHQWAYQRVLIGDALQLLADIPDQSYELVLAIDILEHHLKPQGYRFLAELARVCSRSALVSTPLEFHAQHVEANPLEDHRSHWCADELSAVGYCQRLPNEESLIAVFDRRIEPA